MILMKEGNQSKAGATKHECGAEGAARKKGLTTLSRGGRGFEQLGERRTRLGESKWRHRGEKNQKPIKVSTQMEGSGGGG